MERALFGHPILDDEAKVSHGLHPFIGWKRQVLERLFGFGVVRFDDIEGVSRAGLELATGAEKVFADPIFAGIHVRIAAIFDVTPAPLGVV